MPARHRDRHKNTYLTLRHRTAARYVSGPLLADGRRLLEINKVVTTPADLVFRARGA
jgi:hypothetical protein